MHYSIAVANSIIQEIDVSYISPMLIDSAPGIGQGGIDIFPRAPRKIVEYDNFRNIRLKQGFDDVAPDEPGSSND